MYKKFRQALPFVIPGLAGLLLFYGMVLILALLLAFGLGLVLHQDAVRLAADVR